MGREEGAWDEKRDGKGGQRAASLRRTINHCRRRRPLLHCHGCWWRIKTVLKLGVVGGGGGVGRHITGTAPHTNGITTLAATATSFSQKRPEKAV